MDEMTLDRFLGLCEQVSPEPEFPSVEILRLQPGDILALTTPNWLPKTQFERVAEQLKKMVPEGVDIAILDGGARFTIVRKPEEETDVVVNG